MSAPELKVVLLGDNAVGKSCLSHRFANDEFIAPSALNATIGVAYVSKRLPVGTKKITLGIWDTAGSERYDAMTKLYYRGAYAAIVCYDATRPKTFSKVKYWIDELRRVEESCKIYVCATKKDLLNGDNYTAEHLEEVERYANSLPAKFYVTSSKTGENVEIDRIALVVGPRTAEIFQEIAVDCAPMIKNNKENGRKTGNEFIRLSTDSRRTTCCYSSRNN